MAMSRSLGSSSLTTRPSMAISPAVMSSSPAIMRSRVLLPQPEGPTKTTNSRSAISRSTPCTTSTSPNDFFTLRRLRPATSSFPLGRNGNILTARWSARKADAHRFGRIRRLGPRACGRRSGASRDFRWAAWCAGDDASARASGARPARRAGPSHPRCTARGSRRRSGRHRRAQSSACRHGRQGARGRQARAAGKADGDHARRCRAPGRGRRAIGPLLRHRPPAARLAAMGEGPRR